MTDQAIKNIVYRQPLLGNTIDNPLYISGGDDGGAAQGDYSLLVADMTTRQLLEGILIELKIMNLRQQEVFEEEVKEDDLCE